MSATQILFHSAPRPAVVRRGALVATALSILFLFSGDRGLTQSGGGGGGIDPLEVLRLEVRPNAIIVLDTSGSMHQDLAGNGVAGDDPRSKIFQAKQVLTSVVTANQKKVSFMFGQYAVTNSALSGNNNTRFSYTSADPNARNITVNNISQGLNRTTGQRLPDLSVSGSTCNTSPYTGCVYDMDAGRFWNGQTVTVNSSGNYCTVSNGAATNPPTVTVVQLSTTSCSSGVAQQATFTFVGANSWSGTNVACNGFQQDLSLATCDTNDQITPLSPFLQPEINVTAAGAVLGYNDSGNANGSFTGPTFAGLRALNNTPIAASLNGIRTTYWTPLYNSGLPGPPAIGAIKGKPFGQRQRTFVIFVTDGDDTCAQTSQPTGNGGDNQALTAAYSAERLYTRLDPTDPASSVTTFVVITGNGASATRANWEAWGGSGMVIPPSGNGQAWNRIPTAGDRANCTSCVDAFLASDAAGLTAALQDAIDRGASFGEFSSQESITDSIFELGTNPLDPVQRYAFLNFALMQSTFALPDFSGHVKAYVNNGGTGQLIWDAGEKLCVSAGTTVVAGTPTQCSTTGWVDTFTNLKGGATTFSTIATSSARIKRRIFTTSGNGVNTGYTAQSLVNNSVASSLALVPLWPPDVNVAPTNIANPPGILDGPLGIATMTITDLQKAPFFACLGTNPSSACTSATPAVKLAAARREAREMVLAFTAGAQIQFDVNGLPNRNGANEILYVPRSWIMAESTLAANGIVTQPPEPTPSFQTDEYKLFRDGPRDPQGRVANAIGRGFGLRNPDKGTTYISNSPILQTDNLKPSMSIVYQPTNGMLYALRAGPCPAGFPSCGGQTGGEELWGFVPFDQLGKLIQRMSPQSRSNHTYMMASSVRFADVFVPGTWSTTFGFDNTGTALNGSGAGVWRTILYVGRGAGGKYLTALDVTTPGPFVIPALQTTLPLIVWSRGNPDTSDGQVKSFSNSYNNTTSAGPGDYTAYLKMAQTWSVPAIGRPNDPVANATTRNPSGNDFVAWVGSGFSDETVTPTTQGKTFYALDALTGDVIGSGDVTEDTSRLPAVNALVANAAAFSAGPLSPGFVSNDAAEPVTAVYFPDVQGRIWKFNADTPSTPPVLFSDEIADGSQPFGNAVALLNIQTKGAAAAKPHVFAEAGNDSRVPATEDDPIPIFKAYGLRDDSDPTTTIATPVFPAFDFLQDFRGTTQPFTAFVNTTMGSDAVVFFAATKFNPPGANCLSSFDSQIVALQLKGDGVSDSGGAAYDMTGGPDQRSTVLTSQRVTGITVAQGQVVVSTGLGAGSAPPPPPPARQSSTAGLKADLVAGLGNNPNLTIQNAALVPFKMGSSVCQ